MGRDAGASEHRSPDDLLGSVLGTCTLERILGRGGMGVVYLAQQSRPRRQVAVKTLLLSLMPDPARRTRFLARFRREADAVAALEHPNILPIYEYGEQTDVAYLVMPYVTGGTLRDRVERKGPLPLPEAAGFLTQMAAALDYAHRRGVIHRDVKPQNMLLYPDKRLVLSDFGIAKVAEQAAADGDAPTLPQLTTMGHVVGTPDYIAPEQAMGHPVDARADIYSLGVVLFYMVTGRVPFFGSQPMTVAAKQVSEPPPPPRQFRHDLPSAAERVILKAMAKDPAARYQSAGELAQAFSKAIAQPVLAPGQNPVPPIAGVPAAAPTLPAAAPNKGGRTTRRINTSRGMPGLPIVIAVLVILLLAGGAYVALKYTPLQTMLHPTSTPGVTATVAPTAKPTVAPTPSPTPTATATTTPATLFQATAFEPQQSDLPTGATALTPQTASTPDEYKNLNQNLVVDPTSGKYNWQQEVFVEVDKGGSSYLHLFIEQFTQASDAQTYYADILPHLRSVGHQEQIGQQEVDGLCCDNNASSPNIIYQDQNVVVIVLMDESTPQALQDGFSVAGNMDQRAHQASQTLRPGLPLADLQRQPAAA